VIFDPTTRQIFITYPATPLIDALNADNFQLNAQAKLTGGPIIDWIFDPQRHQLYILNILAPNYRAITILNTSSLDQIALIAGVEDMPLQQASAIALAPNGALLISEADGVWQMNPDDFSITLQQKNMDQAPAGGLKISKNNTIFFLTTHQLEIYR
jgi:hypothetical protein